MGRGGDFPGANDHLAAREGTHFLGHTPAGFVLSLARQFLVVIRIDADQIANDPGDDIHLGLAVTRADQIGQVVALGLNRVLAHFAAHHALEQPHHLRVYGAPRGVVVNAQ